MRRALLSFAIAALLTPAAHGQGALLPVREIRDLRGVEPTARIVGTPVLPGAVATSPLSFVAPPRVKHARFIVTPMPGVRLYSDSVGEVSFSPGDSVSLPITYSVARTKGSGLTTIARVVVTFEDQTSWAADFEAEVRARHSLVVSLTPETGIAYRGKTSRLRLVIANRGNAADTAQLRWNAGGDWQLLDAPLTVYVGPGESVVRIVTIRTPSLSVPGDVHIVQVSTASRGGMQTTSAMLRVAYVQAGSAGFVDAPTTVFLGNTIDDNGASQRSFGLASSGDITPSTQFSLVARHRERSLLDPVFAEELGGQTFRLGIRRNALNAAIGDIWQPGSALTGLIAQGRGVDLQWTGESLRAGVLVARPGSIGSGGQRVEQAAASMATAHGRVGASLTRLERPGATLSDTTTIHTAGLTFALGERGDHFVGAEIGVLHSSDRSGRSMTGFAFDGTVERSNDERSLSARLHATPASPATRDLMPTSLFLSGSQAINERWRALATGSMTSLALDDGRLLASGVSAGASASFASVSATVLGNVRSLRESGAAATTRSTTTRGASASVSVPVWVLTFDGYAEHGATLYRDTTSWSDVLRAGVRWSSTNGWLWAGTTYGRSDLGSVNRSTDFNGAYRRGRSQLQVGTSALVGPRFAIADPTGLAVSNELQVASFWTRLSVNVTSDLAVVAGSTYQQGIGSPWRFSLGLRQKLDMPLPVRRQPIAQGVVFEDRNGNHRRDSGEPSVGGVGVVFGFDKVITAADGAFAFVDPALRGQPLSVDVSSLPSGFLLPADVHLANTGRLSIPLVHAASLQLTLFIDANGDGLRNEESALPEPTIVSVVDSLHREYDATPDANGQVRFQALVPGTYTVTITMPSSGTRSATSRSFAVDLYPGADVRRDVPLPQVRREIRFNNGS